ncbi:MAG: 3-deoxy-D-manno-octulosonic acid transferase [Bacteroidales bacterium]|nr:3-deoxy-D-manno-octulosonic acid transferase [Bacteroidales bacterium]
MKTLYTLGIVVYSLALQLAALWNDKARLLVAGRRRWRATVEAARLQGREVVWFHVASLGEFEQARPVMEALKREHPHYALCLSFFSPSGYEVRKDYAEADCVFYLPADTPRNARRLLQALQPRQVFFVKYDFWFNLMGELRRRQVPTYLFSALFRPQQYFFRPWGGWFRRQLGCFTHIFVQNEASLELLQRHGLTAVSLAGDTRFDRVHDMAAHAPEHPEVTRFADGSPLLVAGSSWEPDELLLARFAAAYEGDLKLVVAPHQIGEGHLRHIEGLFEGLTVRYSLLRQRPDAGDGRRVLLIDNIGLLQSLYRHATVAYIGGGFGHGIHNTLEAVTFGVPVCFGPNHHKFQEAEALLACGGAFTFDDFETLDDGLRRWLGDASCRRQASDACQRYVEANLGSTRRILNLLETH